MASPYSDEEIESALPTLESVRDTIIQLIDWNKNVNSTESYYSSQTGMQLLAANCTLITAIGEGVNRINRVLPDFLNSNFPAIPWKSIIGMRNHICHGYFELDGDVVFDVVKNDIPNLLSTISDAITLSKSWFSHER